MKDRSRRALATRDVVLLALGIVLLGATTWLLLRTSDGDAAPTDQRIPFRCTACDHAFELTHAEFEQRFEAGEITQTDDGARVRCPNCAAMTGKREYRHLASGESDNGE